MRSEFLIWLLGFWASRVHCGVWWPLACLLQDIVTVYCLTFLVSCLCCRPQGNFCRQASNLRTVFAGLDWWVGVCFVWVENCLGAYTRDLILLGLAEVTSSSLPSITHPQAEFVCPSCYHQQFISRHSSAKRTKDVWCERERLECGHLWLHT